MANRNSIVIASVLIFGIVLVVQFHFKDNSAKKSTDSHVSRGIPLAENCNDENFRFTSYQNGSVTSKGAPCDCSLLKYLQMFNLTEKEERTVKKVNFNDVVFVTYASENHFHESKKGIQVLRNTTSGKIIYYDLGLNNSQVVEIQSVCNLEYRKLDYLKYPVHVQYLRSYAFKPIIIAEVYKEFDAFWIIDASSRFFNREHLEKYYEESVSKEGLLFELFSYHSISAATHSGMYKYLPIDPKLSGRAMFDANTMFFRRSTLAKEITTWNVLCALEEECIAPTGSQILCNFKRQKANEHGIGRSNYGGCHRYDQSAINIIATNIREKYNIPQPSWNETGFSRFAAAVRRDVRTEPLNVTCTL